MEEKQLIYVVGKNAPNNWEIYDNASKDAYIFHLVDYSSCYVICEDLICKDNIKKLALVCKLGTKYKNMKDIKVLYTKKSNTYKGQEVGSFIIRNPKFVNEITV